MEKSRLDGNGDGGTGHIPQYISCLDQDLPICIYTVRTWASACWSSSYTTTVNGRMKGQVLDTDSRFPEKSPGL